MMVADHIRLIFKALRPPDHAFAGIVGQSKALGSYYKGN